MQDYKTLPVSVDFFLREVVTSSGLLLDLDG
jgi:hypothetical protein